MPVNSDRPIEDTGIPGLSTAGFYDTGAHGSAGGMRPASDEYGEQTVSAGYDPSVTTKSVQGYTSTQADGDVMKDGFSGVSVPVAAPPGRVCGPPHPTSTA